MQIDSIELFHVALPLKRPLQTPAGGLDTLETVLVRMHSGKSAGWGEASPGNAPTATTEWAAGVFGCLRDHLAPAIVSMPVDSGDQLQERLDPFRGNRFAKAGLDTAWWDLEARRQDRPLHQLLGGKREKIDVGVTFDRMDSIDEFLAAIGRAEEAGFGRVKLKFRPGWDIQMVDFVRKEFPTLTVHIDCEGALHLGHSEMLCRLDDFCLAMIEQPLAADDLVGHAMVQEMIKTPICLDEGVTTVAQAEVALELHSCRYLNLKPGRLGGLTPAVAIHDACHESCVPCYVGAMPQTAVGARLSLALAAKENCTFPADYFPGEEVLQQDLAEPLQPTVDASDGRMRITLWSEAGIGIDPDPELLDKFSIARAKL